MSWSRRDGYSVRGHGALVVTPRSSDEADLAKLVADLRVEWGFITSDHLGGVITWDAPAIEAYKRVASRRPGEVVARAGYTRSSPPKLPTPIVSIDVIADDPGPQAEFRSLGELAYSAPAGRIVLQLDLLGFYRPGPRPQLEGVPVPTSEEFTEGTRAFGWLEYFGLKRGDSPP